MKTPCHALVVFSGFKKPGIANLRLDVVARQALEPKLQVAELAAFDGSRQHGLILQLFAVGLRTGVPYTQLDAAEIVTVTFMVVFNRFFRKNLFYQFLKFLRYQAIGPVF